jgi:hypothetical protein
MDITLDTGSDWVILQDSECSTCSGSLYDSSSSNSFTTTNTAMSLSYGSAAVTGIDGDDSIYLDD